MKGIHHTPAKRKESVPIDSIARMIGLLIEPGKAHTAEDLDRICMRPAFGMLVKSTKALAIVRALKFGYITQVGKTRGSRYFLNVRPMPNSKEEKLIAYCKDLNYVEVLEEVANPPAAPASAPMPEGPVQTTLAAAAKEPEELQQSSVWTNQRFVEKDDGSKWVIITTKICLRKADVT